MSDLNQWIDKVKGAQSSIEIFSILDQFRSLEWTDEQRSLMSKCYIAALGLLDTLSFASDPLPPIGLASDADKHLGKEELDEIGELEPVWYERL